MDTRHIDSGIYLKAHGMAEQPYSRLRLETGNSESKKPTKHQIESKSCMEFAKTPQSSCHLIIKTALDKLKRVCIISKYSSLTIINSSSHSIKQRT